VSEPPGEGDGWSWDGERWQYAGEAAAESAPPPSDDDTGQWVWDGSQWQPVGN
jgi:hypothetical protein